MTKEIAKKESTAIAAPVHNNAWGSEGMDAADVVIPKLLLMQGQSEYVSEGKAKAGDIVKSTNGELLGGVQAGVEIIAFMTYKTWVVSQSNGSRYEFRRIEPITVDNVNAELEWEEDGRSWRRDRSLNFYVLLPSDIAKEIKALKALEATGDVPDSDDALLPCVLSFRRTSYGAGKDLISHFAKMASFNQPAAVSKFKLGAKIEKNDQGTFYVFTMEKVGKSTPEEIAACKRWYETITHTKVKVDDSDEKQVKQKAAPKDKATPSRGTYANKGNDDVDIENVF